MRGIEQFLQVDAATLGALKYAGTWNASTNTPTLASGVGVQGQYYVVSVAGSTNLDGETAWQVGDWAVFNGSVWQKVDGGSTGLLTTLTVTGNTFLATTSGDVGIGTSSPAQKLHVVSTGDVAQFTNGTRSAYLALDSGGYSLFTGASQTGNGVYANATSNFVQLFTNGTAKATLDSPGNLGLGVTPSAWYGNYKALQLLGGSGFASNASGDLLLSSNYYIDGSAVQRYVFTGYATQYEQYQGKHQWYTAPSGTAGNAISFTQAMTLDASGNLGLGVTPSAWTSYKALQINTGASLASTSNQMVLGSNWLFDGSDKYVISDYSTLYIQNSGQHKWYTAPSGTAGNAISFNQPMTLDASGNLSIGQTSSALQSAGTGITLYGSSASEIKFLNSTTGSSATDGTALVATGADFIINNRESGAVTLGTSNTERARITSGGDVLVGSTSGPYSAANRGYINISGSTDSVLGLSSGSSARGYLQGTATAVTLGATSGSSITFDINGERARIPAAGGMVVGTAAIATNATDGFLYVSTCAGTPTGTPTTQTGTAPIVIDTTNNKLYFYSGGQWRDAGP